MWENHGCHDCCLRMHEINGFYKRGSGAAQMLGDMILGNWSAFCSGGWMLARTNLEHDFVNFGNQKLYYF